LITRNAVDADIPEIVRVINLAYRVEDFFKVGDRTTAEDIRARIAARDSHVVVVDAPDGGIAGAVCMEINDNRGHFGMLSVDPAHRGKGVARALIEGVEERCKAAGCSDVDIEVVNLRQELPAFYSKLGFAVKGTKSFWPPEELTREAHMVIWSKPIE
jgi:GNAT superfamily N-acetyltransferase